MVSETQERQGTLSPLLILIDGALSQSSFSVLSEEERALLTDDLALLAVMQRLAFRSVSQRNSKSQRLNTEFER